MSDRRQTAKRDAILAAATAGFRDEGYETVSMDRIAELARVSKRTVYNHFGSKESLFHAVVDQLIDRAKALKRVMWEPTRPLADQLGEFAAAKTAIARDPAWSGLLRVVLGVVIRNPELAAQTTLRAADGEDALVRWLQAAHADGQLRVASPVLAANVFWAGVSGALFWPEVFGMPMTDAERATITGELIETFLARYRG